MTEEVINF